MKSHPNVCARRSRCFLCAALVLPLALLAVDRSQCAATNSSAARTDSPAIARPTSPNSDVASLKLASHNLLALTSGHASRGPRGRDDRGEILPADTTLTWNTFLGGFAIIESDTALAIDGSGNVY